MSNYGTLAYLEKILTPPEDFSFPRSVRLVKRYTFETFDAELYLQANGIRKDGTLTYQRVMVALPKNIREKTPTVVVPFYYPEATLGFDLETKNILDHYKDNATTLHLLAHGYIVVTADAYYLNYVESDLEIGGFGRWKLCGDRLNADYPDWCGMGKLMFDTQLLLDLCEQDERVDKERIGIAGHSLGGKMAFFTGCFDKRPKVIMASDFGMCWHNTNWEAPWYFGEKIKNVTANGFTLASVLEMAAPKPFCLLAGNFDNIESRALMDSLTEKYKDCPQNLFFVDHKSGHRPPKYAAESGYLFLDYILKDEI